MPEVHEAQARKEAAMPPIRPKLAATRSFFHIVSGVATLAIVTFKTDRSIPAVTMAVVALILISVLIEWVSGSIRSEGLGRAFELLGLTAIGACIILVICFLSALILKKPDSLAQIIYESRGPEARRVLTNLTFKIVPSNSDTKPVQLIISEKAEQIIHSDNANAVHCVLKAPSGFKITDRWMMVTGGQWKKYPLPFGHSILDSQRLWTEGAITFDGDSAEEHSDQGWDQIEVYPQFAIGGDFSPKVNDSIQVRVGVVIVRK